MHDEYAAIYDDPREPIRRVWAAVAAVRSPDSVGAKRFPPFHMPHALPEALEIRLHRLDDGPHLPLTRDRGQDKKIGHARQPPEIQEDHVLGVLVEGGLCGNDGAGFTLDARSPLGTLRRNAC